MDEHRKQILVQYYFYLLFYLNCEDQQQTVYLIEKIVEVFASVNSFDVDSGEDPYETILRMAMIDPDAPLFGKKELAYAFAVMVPNCLGPVSELRCPSLQVFSFTRDNSLFDFLKENARSQAVKEYFNL